MPFYKIPLRDSKQFEAMYDYVVVEADDTEDAVPPVEMLIDMLYEGMGEFDDDQPLGWSPEELTLEQALASSWPIFTKSMFERESEETMG